MNSIAIRFTLAVLAGGLLAGCGRNSRALEHYVAGQLAIERRQYAPALAELKRALALNPNLTVAHSAIGDVHRKQGRYDLAASAYQLACETNPYAFRPHYNLAVTYQFLAVAAHTARAAADYMRNAVRIYLRAVTLRPEDFDTNLNLSACYYQQGKYALAEQYCKAAIEIDAENPFAYSNLGIIYDAQNRPYEAIRAFKDSLELDTHQPKLLQNLGSTYMRLGRLTDAIKAFRLSGEQDPASSAPWEQIGTCYYHQKKWPDAVAAFDKAIRLDARSAAAFRGLGVVQMTRFVLDRGRPDLRDKALTAWNRSLKLNPNQPDLLRLVRKYSPALAGQKL